ncbi:unnamed protein product [Rhizophagus irregularis]|nr:unnamed protein product [Rhizophagus irregularis]
MGEFLSEPIEDKNTTEGICQQHDLIYVTSTMQGWRKNMEDMHTVECNVSEGKYTSEYISKNLHYKISKKFMKLVRVGSTAVVTVITPNKIVYVRNAGASRVVMNVGGLAIHLSVDHKPNIDRESQRIIQAGS